MFLINTSIKCLVLDCKIRHPDHLHQEEEHGSYMSKYFKKLLFKNRDKSCMLCSFWPVPTLSLSFFVMLFLKSAIVRMIPPAFWDLKESSPILNGPQLSGYSHFLWNKNIIWERYPLFCTSCNSSDRIIDLQLEVALDFLVPTSYPQTENWLRQVEQLAKPTELVHVRSQFR